MSIQSSPGRAGWAIVLALLASPHVLHAQTLPAGFESVRSFRTVRVADGVYAFITPEERTGFQAGNSMAVIGDDGVLIVDTGNIPSATRRQIAEVKKLTNKPVRYVVNTHWHPDHNLGNGEYRAAFPGVTVVSTSATRAQIIERTPVYFSQIRGFAPTDSLMRLRLSTGKRRDGTPLSEEQKVMWALNVADFAEFVPEVTSATMSPPNLVVDDSLTVHLGNRAVRIVSVGRANTAGDLVVIVPDAGVVATGDILTVPCPFPSSSFFSGWIAALDRVKTLAPSAIVPGHGDVQRDLAFLNLTRDLLAYTRDEARKAVRQGLSLEDAQKQIDFTAFEQKFGGGNLVRTDGFNSFYTGVGVQRAYDEAKYESQGPVAK